MQVEYKSPTPTQIKTWREVLDYGGTEEALEMAWEDGYWAGVERAFLLIRGFADAWQENVV